MNEITKHINDTNASYRTLGAGDAKNTDLFLDNEHYFLFEGEGEQITVRFNKENLTKAILFIASILPRKYDNSSVYKTIPFSYTFVYEQLAFLDAFFTIDGVVVDNRTQKWNARKDVPKKNGEIDNRFYFNGLLEDIQYTNHKGERTSAKFTIRNYLAGGYSDIHIKKSEDGIFDVWVTNALKPYDNEKKDDFLTQHKSYSISAYTPDQPLQQIFYGAPGTGKSHTIKQATDAAGSDYVFRTTFHPDSDYSTFVGCYKPKMEIQPRYNPQTGEQMGTEKKIVYSYTPQAFTKAYVKAYQCPDKPVYLIIEEINRGNCAQIFGDLFQLLDRKECGHSCYPIKADQDMMMHLMEVLAGYDAVPENVRSGEELVLPPNLYIWATMNTSDQSLFPIDSAFKRRWDWKYIPIAQGKDKETGKLLQWSIEAEGVRYDWWSFLTVMNKRVGDITSSEDKKLGFFFCKVDDEGVISATKFVGKVLFYLWNDVFKDYPDNPIAMHLKEEGAEFTYGDFYTTDAKGEVVVREELVTRLMEALEVERVGN